MATADLAALPRPALGEPIASLADQRDEIIAAVEFLFTGL